MQRFHQSYDGLPKFFYSDKKNLTWLTSMNAKRLAIRQEAYNYLKNKKSRYLMAKK